MAEVTPPAGARKTYHGVVERVTTHNADTRSLFLCLPAASEFRFLPGQFISVAIPTDEQRRTRAYSLALSPKDGQPLEICLNLIPQGIGSQYLFSLEVGAEVSFTGPFGLFTLEHPPSHETVFIAEGTAIAPIRAMIRHALGHSRPPLLTLLYVASDQAHLLYRAEFERFTREHTSLVFEPRIHPSGQVSALLDEIEQRYVKSDSSRERHFYICGVGNDVLRVRDLLRAAGYARRAVQYERW